MSNERMVKQGLARSSCELSEQCPGRQSTTLPHCWSCMLEMGRCSRVSEQKASREQNAACKLSAVYLAQVPIWHGAAECTDICMTATSSTYRTA